MKEPVPDTARAEWEGRVYGLRSVDDAKREAAWWRFLTASILRRDKRRCKRCNLRGTTDNPLSVHHVIPRAEAGTDDFENLLTLCRSCHNWVEPHDPPLRTAAEIEASILGDKMPKPMSVADGSDWHEWVYGGAKNPNV